MFSVANTWNPDKYNPEKWIVAAHKADFGYFVLTTRHHDGYALWSSKHGTWDTGEYMDGRDLVKDYVEACRNNEIRAGFYYSGPNWHYGVECETNQWDTNTLLSELVRIRSLGGNLLVNVPPRGNGEMMEWFYEACDEMSGWLKYSREAVYDVDLEAPLPTMDKKTTRQSVVTFTTH